MIYPVTSAALKGHGGRNLAHNGNSTGYPEEPDIVLICYCYLNTLVASRPSILFCSLKLRELAVLFPPVFI